LNAGIREFLQTAQKRQTAAVSMPLDTLIRCSAPGIRYAYVYEKLIGTKMTSTFV